MEKLLACCGLNCAACDARIATITNDDALRARLAEQWKIQYNAPDFTASMIHCTGCTEFGAKIGHCAECEIRRCALAKNYQTCAECEQLDTCTTIAAIHQFVPEALQNLKELS